ncbi:membrane protease YdiL (CAAX protease family) [Natronospira proteinivora]|uniref:Membrane protease YdiL (CAAX protease family) n=1 Tax=Natronospira proteinivora TaxID=1807133 RepID=A0ABT1G997_9GAMM|nr:membrane protease YdiL (CAAX protease family) [Natronospira proteinivora]
MEEEEKTGHPLYGALLFQAAFIPVALILALWLGLTPWADLHFDLATIGLTLAGTALMFLFYMALLPFGFQWARRLETQVAEMMATLFQGKSQHWALLLAILAGVGEELLFRGVIQAGLAEWLGWQAGLILSSLLFGLAHCISRAYFIIACLMGFYMGLIYLWSGNLLLVILIHALYDWLAFQYYLRRLPSTTTPQD